VEGQYYESKESTCISHFRDAAFTYTFYIMSACCNTSLAFDLSPFIIMKGFELKEVDVPVMNL
jgi:hypothetical protein